MVRSGKYREGWWEKFWGDAPLRIGERPCLWFHAVSVGEVLLLRPLVQGDGATEAELGGGHLDHDDDGTGRRSADLSGAHHLLCTLGLQLGHARAMLRIRPTVLALVELELWPNLIRAAKQLWGQGGDHQRPALHP